MRNPIVRSACVALAFALATGLAAAQAYPNRPVKVVVPFAAGSGSDVYARLIADDFRSAFGQTFFIENKAGASAQIGTLQVAKSPADGYTLLIATNTGHSANPALFKKLPYDPVADFTGIGRILYMPYLLVVPKASPLNSVAALIERARSAPGALNCGYGNSSGQVAAAEFSRQARISASMVPYKSMPPAMTDLIGGQIDFLFADVSTALPHLQAGTIRALGFSLEKRSAQLPDVPSIAESPGMAGFELTSWVGLVGPAGMPADVIERLATQLRRTLGKPDVRDKLVAMGAEVAPSSPAEMDQFVKQQLASWGTKIRNAGIQPE
jgi:tripartite-type tricarboxylate transporter receptor subunit TctC